MTRSYLEPDDSRLDYRMVRHLMSSGCTPQLALDILVVSRREFPSVKGLKHYAYFERTVARAFTHLPKSVQTWITGDDEDDTDDSEEGENLYGTL